ncbi:MAG: thiamine pyrophosphate-dependent enzyme [Candidatus Omnitrophota bacterium]
MKASELVRLFKRKKLGPFIQVPCSMLSSLIRDLSADPDCEVLNPANEAVAMGMAAGTYLATQKIPVVLMQNSGLCNTLNALTSLHQVYHLPVLFLITWRGMRGAQDAPEHQVMGAKLNQILRLFNIPYAVLSPKNYRVQVAAMIAKMKKSGMPAALVLRPDVIDKDTGERKAGKAPQEKAVPSLTRSEALGEIFSVWGRRACYVTTNGFISRDAFHAAGSQPGKPPPVFYMLGSMGHALPLGLGLSLSRSRGAQTVVIDGDGGALMHLGAMASVPGTCKGSKKNLLYIVLDNCLYASTGGQPTVSSDVRFRTIAEACGFRRVFSATGRAALKSVLLKTRKLRGSVFIHARISEVKNCPSPRVSSRFSCQTIKQNFMGGLT